VEVTNENDLDTKIQTEKPARQVYLVSAPITLAKTYRLLFQPVTFFFEQRTTPRRAVALQQS
jgi:hypothetical protein